MKKNDYLQPEDLGKLDITVTIKERKLETFINPDTGQPEKKWVLYFKEDVKPLVLDRTNFEILNKLFGGETHH